MNRGKCDEKKWSLPKASLPGRDRYEAKGTSCAPDASFPTGLRSRREPNAPRPTRVIGGYLGNFLAPDDPSQRSGAPPARATDSLGMLRRPGEANFFRSVRSVCGRNQPSEKREGIPLSPRRWRGVTAGGFGPGDGRVDGGDGVKASAAFGKGVPVIVLAKSHSEFRPKGKGDQAMARCYIGLRSCQDLLFRNDRCDRQSPCFVVVFTGPEF